MQFSKEFVIALIPLNNAITNGFNNTNMGMMQGFNGVERGFCNLSSQLAQSLL